MLKGRELLQVELDAVPGKVLRSILEEELSELLDLSVIEEVRRKNVVKARQAVKKAVETDWSTDRVDS